jgi:hypothetical protein
MRLELRGKVAGWKSLVDPNAKSSEGYALKWKRRRPCVAAVDSMSPSHGLLLFHFSAYPSLLLAFGSTRLFFVLFFYPDKYPLLTACLHHPATFPLNSRRMEAPMYLEF